MNIIILSSIILIAVVIIFILIRYHIFKKIIISLFSGNGYFFREIIGGTHLLKKNMISYDKDKKIEKLKMKDINNPNKEEVNNKTEVSPESNEKKENIPLTEKIGQIKIPIKKIHLDGPDTSLEKSQEQEKKESQKDKIKKILPKINDKDILAILEYITNKDYNIPNLVISDKLDINNEFLDILKKQIIAFLKDRLDNLKSDRSLLRKKGVDMSYLSMKLMSVPLKIKMFEASFDKDDFFKITEILEFCENELKNYNDKNK